MQKKRRGGKKIKNHKQSQQKGSIKIMIYLTIEFVLFD